jgi:hypothetical protein
MKKHLFKYSLWFAVIMLTMFTTQMDAANVVDTNLFNAVSNGGNDDSAGWSFNFSSSTKITGDTIEDAFGNKDGGVEATSFIFANGFTIDNGNAIMGDGGERVDYIQWQTTLPVALAGFRFEGAGDGGGTNRGTELVRFLVEGVEVDLFDNNYGSVAVDRLFAGGVVTGSTFRIELTRTASSGPRIKEIDAIVDEGFYTFQDYFHDTFDGGGSATAPGSISSDATTASSKVSDYIVDTGWVTTINTSPNGNLFPALNLFNGQVQATNSANSLHLNLTTVPGATYTIAFQASMWGSTAGNVSYALSAEVFDGADTLSGSALDSDAINTSAGFTMETIFLSFAAESTATTLYLDGTIGDTFNHNVWVDNLDIHEDLSTQNMQGIMFTIK